MALKQEKIIFYLALLSLAAALTFSYLTPAGDMRAVMAEALPEAASFSRVSASNVYIGHDGGGNVVGYVSFDQASGYDGDIITAVGLSAEGKILHVGIVRHRDTPAFIQMLGTHKYLESFEGKHAGDRLGIGEDIDAVSGATFSSQGVARAVAKASHAVGRTQLGLNVTEPSVPWRFGPKEAAVFALLALTLAGVKAGKYQKALRWLVMLGSIAVIGFIYSSTVSLSNYAGLFMGNLPPVKENLTWYALILGVPLLAFLLRQNIHCVYLCPFGACQEIAGKIGAGKVKLGDAALERRLRKVRYIFTYLALLGAFLLSSPGFAGYEPFAALFALKAFGVQWFILPAALFIALFIPRFWCRYFCPVGVIQDLAVKLGIKFKKGLTLWKSKKESR